MKRKLEDQCKFAAVFAFMALILWSCESDDPNDVGLGLLPGSDLTSVGYAVETETNQSFTHNDTILRTDEPQFNLLGTFNDPEFGKTQADFACQFRLASFPDFGENQQIDSLVLVLLYREVYGDTLTPQNIKVYELESDLDVDARYDQNTDLKSLASTNMVGELEYIPKFQLDTTGTDTITQELVVKLDNALAQKLLNADSLDMINNDVFLDYFKGFYVETQEISEGGGLVAINTLAFGSRMSLYYTADFDTVAAVDTVYDYFINSNSARVSRFLHDYSQTDFVGNLNSEDNQDSLIYIQTMGGLRAKIDLPFLDAWADSSNIGINKAELIFHVDTIASDYENYGVPSQLLLRAIKEDKDDYYPEDLSISAALYGGFFNNNDKTYRFNITRHLQNLVRGADDPYGEKTENKGFYLSTSLSNIQARRVILKGATSQTGIRLEVTYTRYN